MAGPDRLPWVPARPPGAEDLPYDDGEPMETPRHRRQMNILIDSLEHAWKERDDVFVGGNMYLYFDMRQTETNDFRGPDVFVVLDAAQREHGERRERLSWVVWEEGGKTPDVVIELTSPTTASVDRETKMDLYAKVLAVGEYFIYDPLSEELEGYTLDLQARRYDPVEPADDGSLPCAQLELRLKVVEAEGSSGKNRWLRWLSKKEEGAWDVLPTPLEEALSTAKRDDEDVARIAEAERRATEAEKLIEEMHKLVDEADKRTEEAEQMAQELEQRAHEAERRAEKAEKRAEEHARRADDQAKRAEVEKQRADSEARRAVAEAKRADAEARRVKELSDTKP